MRALYYEWVKTWEAYKKGTQDVMALSRKAVGQIAHDAHELNTKTVNKIGLEADAMLSAARSLSGDSSRLRLEVGKFLESVRAA
jgi:hypothetical protein